MSEKQSPSLNTLKKSTLKAIFWAWIIVFLITFSGHIYFQNLLQRPTQYNTSISLIEDQLLTTTQLRLELLMQKYQVRGSVAENWYTPLKIRLRNNQNALQASLGNEESSLLDSLRYSYIELRSLMDFLDYGNTGSSFNFSKRVNQSMDDIITEGRRYSELLRKLESRLISARDEDTYYTQMAFLFGFIFIAIAFVAQGILMYRSLIKEPRFYHDTIKTLKNEIEELQREVNANKKSKQLAVAQLLELETDMRVAKNNQYEVTRKLTNTSQELNYFARVVSSQMKSSLKAIKNLTEWTIEDETSTLSVETNKNLSLINARVLRMVEFIEKIELYVQADHFTEETQRVNIQLLTSQIITNFKQEKLIEIEGTLPVLNTYKNAFYNLLFNLIKSIVDKSTGKAHIVISCEERIDFFEFQLTTNLPAKFLSLNDNSFNLFTSDKNQWMEMDVGLAISRKIVEAQNGKIWLSEPLNNGVSIIFTWPIEPNY